MAYDSNKQLITAPVDMGDIATALGEESLDLGTLYESENINKFSRRKPVRRPEIGALTDQMFEGTSTDKADNIHFGIKINGPVDAEIGPSLAQIHNTTFDYIHPKIADGFPCRMLDFEGYKHNAMPNPGASFQLGSRENGVLTAYYNDGSHQYGSLSGIVVQYDDTNTYGVDFTHLLRDSSESLLNSLKRSYPCILVTDNRGVSYFTALDHPNDGQPQARPLYYNNAYQRSTNWSVRFDKPTLNTGIGGSTTKPWNSLQTGMKATIFLVKSADTNGPYLDFAKTQNFSENWVPAANPILITGKPIVLPADVLGAPLTLTQHGAARAYFQPTGIDFQTPILIVEYTMVGSISEMVTFECSVRIGSITAKRTSQVAPGGILIIPSFTASDFGLVSFVGGGEYTVNVSIKTTDSTGSTTKSGTYKFTA